MKGSLITILIVFCGIGATAQPAAVAGADSMGKATVKHRQHKAKAAVQPAVADTGKIIRHIPAIAAPDSIRSKPIISYRHGAKKKKKAKPRKTS